MNTCVEGIGFKRAMLFIPHGDHGRLTLVKAEGFDPGVEKKIHAIALAPITIDGRLTGVLGVDVIKGKRKISEKRTKTLNIVANEAGMAIERARFMEEAVKRREFIESIFSNMLSGLIVLDRSGAMLSANPRVLNLFNCSWEEMRRSTFPPCGTGRKIFRPLIIEIEVFQTKLWNRQ